MGKLRIVELVGENFEPKRHYFGFNRFHKGAMSKGKGEIDYYCFNPSEGFLLKLSLEEKLSPQDVYDSPIFTEFCWFSYNLLMYKYPEDSTTKNNFHERYIEIKKEILIAQDELIGLKGIQRNQELNSRIQKLPFYSSFWGELLTFENNFLKSDFNIKYFDEIKEELVLLEEVGKEKFNRRKYNQHLFGKRYELFSEIPLKDLINDKHQIF